MNSLTRSWAHNQRCIHLIFEFKHLYPKINRHFQSLLTEFGVRQIANERVLVAIRDVSDTLVELVDCVYGVFINQVTFIYIPIK